MRLTSSAESFDSGRGTRVASWMKIDPGKGTIDSSRCIVKLFVALQAGQGHIFIARVGQRQHQDTGQMTLASEA